MMRTGRRSRVVAAAVVFLLAGLTPVAAQDFFVIRADSLNGALADIETVTQAAGKPVDRNMILGTTLGLFGVTDPAMLDLERPMAVALPFQGMMLGPGGFIAALPMKDTAPYLEALTGRYAGHEVVDETLHVFTAESGPGMTVRSLEGYVVAGMTRELVSAFDLEETLVGGNPLPGNLSMDVNLEQAAPMIQMGLMTARQQMVAQLQQEAAAGQEMPFDPADMAPLFDMYFEVIGGMMGNISLLQLGFEVDAGHVIVHEHFVPKVGSTFEGLAAAQQGLGSGMTELARMIDSDAVFVGVGRMESTPAFNTAMQDLMGKYMRAVFPLLSKMLTPPAGEGTEGEAAAEPPSFDTLLASIDRQFERQFRCTGTDSAGSFDFVPGQGLVAVQVYSWKQSDDCRVDFAQDLKEAQEIVGELPDFQEFLQFGQGPVIAGVPTLATTVNLEALVKKFAASEPELPEVITGIYGKTIQVYEAYPQGKYLMVLGGDAEARLRKLLESGATGDGVSADAFLPLSVGSGGAMVMNVGRLLERLQPVLPDEARESEGFTSAIEAFSGPAGRIPFAFQVDTGGATMQAAVPLAAVEAIANLVGMQQAEAAEHDHSAEGHEHP